MANQAFEVGLSKSNHTKQSPLLPFCFSFFGTRSLAEEPQRVDCLAVIKKWALIAFPNNRTQRWITSSRIELRASNLSINNSLLHTNWATCRWKSVNIPSDHSRFNKKQ